MTKTEICVNAQEEILGSGDYYEVFNGNLDGVYRLMRNCHLPGLFSFPVPESKMRKLQDRNAELESKRQDLVAKIAGLEAEKASLEQKK